MKKTYSFILIIFTLLSVFVMAQSNVKLNNLRYFAYNDYTRFVLDLSAPIKIIAKSLPGKNDFRLYFDLKNCSLGKLYPANNKKEIKFNTGHLRRIRIAQRGKSSLRVVFDFTEVGKYNLFYLRAPFRIVLDLYKSARKTIIVKSKKISGKISGNTNDKLEIIKTPESIRGQYSIARQLGLGVRRIIIDPGHGGKDPGTISLKYKLYEKDIVLDIAKKLKKLFKTNKSIDIILTRGIDKYIRLEERTAIANSNKGDIFISIHVNSSPRKKVNGIETYFLSMTTDPRAIRVAAQENAVSKNSLAELSGIVDKIIKNTKKEESKTLANIVQKELVKKTGSKYRGVTNLGVKKAPFYVLVGANMPAILVEVSFLSNRVEAERLKRNTYRQIIAKGIYVGIMKYIKTLGKI
jgi:N-acetylmuramoyl-L-alanine amidase